MNPSVSRKLPQFFVTAGLVALALPAAAQQNGHAAHATLDVASRSAEHTTLTFEFTGFDRERVSIDGVDYERLSMEGAGTVDMKGVGHPALPVYGESVLIPDAARMTARIIDSEYYDIEGVLVAPHRGAILRNVDPDTVPYTFGADYQVNAMFPADVVHLTDPYILHDVRGQVVRVSPLQYNPVARTLRVYTRVEIEVFADGAGTRNVIDRGRAPLRSCYSFEQLYRNQFCNYAGARTAAGRAAAPLEDGDMLIVSYGPFMTAMAPFVTWKTSLGMSVTMVDVATIGGTASSIKSHINTVYSSSNLSYVLLVGDAAQVPTFSAHGGESDPSYSTLTPDMYPDILVGRFSAENTAQVDTQVQRTVDYETSGHSTGMGGWNAKGMGIASSEGAGIGHYGEADYDHQNLIRGELLAAGFTSVDQVYEPSATLSDVVNGLNDGRRCINYIGHGYTYGWSTTGFDTTAIDGLTNVGKLPFVQSVACLGGDFSSTTSFGEAWLRATYNGQPTGAIAAYCSSINQSWAPPMYGQGNHSIGSQYGANERFWMETNWSVGGCWYGGSCTMMDIEGTAGQEMFDTWHLFGDPSVRLIEDPPLSLSLTASVPDRMMPGEALDLEVKILDGLEQYVPGTGKFFYRLDGGAFIEVALTSIGGDLYTASLPHTRSDSVPEFYFSAEGDGGTTIYRPGTAPASTYTFDVCFEMVALEENFDVDPGWVRTGQWDWGTPTGGGGTSYGNPDPTSGYTGDDVLGYNLNGDYAPSLGLTHVTTDAFDFTNVQGAQIKFWRWLNVEQPVYDHAKLTILADGVPSTVWENEATIEDSAWTQVSYDISAAADGASEVKFRWTMGPTDSAWEYSGWNIDDVSVVSYDYSATLWAEQYEISAGAGGSSDLVLDAGIAHAGELYVVAGSLAGTDPGFDVLGLHVPLNWDQFTNWTVQLAGTAYFQNFSGFLDGAGEARATFDTQGPLDISWVGNQASFAYATLPTSGFVSNPVTVTFVN